MIVKDLTSYSQRDMNREPSILRVESSSHNFNYNVHRHIYYPGTWLLSISAFNVECEDLKTNDLDKALKKARERVSELIERRIIAYKDIQKELEAEP